VNVFMFYSRRVLKRPMTLLVSLVLPLALAYGVVLQYESSSSLTVHVSVSDPVLRHLITKELRSGDVAVETVSRSDRSSVSGVLVALDQSVEDVYASPTDFAPVVSARTTTATTALLSARADAVLSAVPYLARSSTSEAAFVESLRSFETSTSPLDTEATVVGNENSVVLVSAFNMIVFVMLLLTMTNIMMFLKDKSSTTTQRVLAGTTTKLGYYLQIVLVFAVLGVAELLVIIGAMTLLFDIPLGVSLGRVLTLVGAYALLNVFAIALGLLLVSRTTKESVGRIVVTAVVLPLSMLGGALWPLSITPDWMQKAAAVLPTTWVTQLNASLFSGFEPSTWDVARPLLLLALVSVALFALLSRVPSDRV
jgi:ABC-type multidrug transport system permease subunit